MSVRPRTGSKFVMHRLCFILFLLAAGDQLTIAIDQQVDTGFNTHVARPAYAKNGPRVLYDEAHNNTDTSAGRYAPFCNLITSDGYRVVPNNKRLSRELLAGTAVVVIVNPSGPEANKRLSPFTDAECDAVRDWVRSGGALLLICDHAPFSTAASRIAERFDIDLTKGFTIDSIHHNKESEDETELVFSRENGLLGQHPITRGRDATEQINRIITFSGTSIRGPAESVPFLKLAETAKDVFPYELKAGSTPEGPIPDARQASAAGRAQGMALVYGKGRVVVLGEAAMLTAQVAARGFSFGMNVSGIDNRQLALNIMHWLSGLLK